MIYLFNSAYRSLYTTNVLNTLFLPVGCTNEYRYRHSGTGSIHINPDSFNNFLNTESGIPVCIIFIDRFSKDGYTYHPLRLGNLVSVKDQDSRLYFKVALGQFVFPRSFDLFNQELIELLGEAGLPKLTGEDPLETSDGFYAIQGGNLIQGDNFSFGDEAWGETVDRIRLTRAFRNYSDDEERAEENVPSREAVFLQAKIIDKQGNEISGKTINGNGLLRINNTSNYQLRLTYRYPSQLDDPGCEASMEIVIGENLKSQGKTLISLDSYNNSIDIPFSTKKNLEEWNDSIGFKFTPSNKFAKILSHEKSLDFKFGESTTFWVMTIFFGFLYLFTGALTAPDPFTWKEFLLGPFHNLPVFGASLLNGISLYIILRFLGKNIFK